MEGSESGAALFEDLNLNPQIFINEVLNSVDEMVDGAFDYYNQEAAKIVEVSGTERGEDLEKGVVYLKKKVQRVLDQKLALWEKYCISHVFAVPEGFSLPKQSKAADDMSIDLDGLTDQDAQLDSLRKKLALVGKESAQLNSELQILEKKSATSSRCAAAVNETMHLYEQNSDLFQELITTASVLRDNLEQLVSKRKYQIEESRNKKLQNSSSDSSILDNTNGFSSANLEDLQKFVLDMKSMVN